MTQNSFSALVRGFDVEVETSDQPDTYKVSVSENGGSPWVVDIPVDMDTFEGDNEEIDGSNELLTFVAEAAVDLFEAQRNTLGQGAGALEVTAMQTQAQQNMITRSGCMGDGGWQQYFLQLQGTPFEGKAVELIKQWLDLAANEPEFEDRAKDLREEKGQLIYQLNLLELELLQHCPQQQMVLIIGKRKQSWLGDIDIPTYLDIFAGTPYEADAVNLMKGVLDIDERIQQVNRSDSGWDEHYQKMDSIEMQLQDLVLTCVQDRTLQTQTGMDSAPNMANDIAELMDGVDLHAPLMAAKRLRSFDEEFETAEDRETEGGEIRHDLDTGCIDPEDYKFEPNQKVKLNKALEIMIGGGIPVEYSKGTPGIIESRYDGEGDFYYVRFEDGQMARVLFSDLSAGGGD